MSTETSTGLRLGCRPTGRRKVASCLAVLFSLTFFFAFSDSAQALESRIIEVQYRNAKELLSVATPMLSPAGRISSDARTNSLIVVDTPESVERIIELLRRLDRPPIPLRIDVSFQKATDRKRQEVTAEGSVSGDGWEVSRGRSDEDGAHIRIHDRTRTESRSESISVTTLSGSPAYVTIGTEIPYDRQKAGVCRRYGGCPPTVEFHRVETGFWVTPRVSGDHIDLEIVPQVADLASGRRIRFAAASTHVVVRPSQWTKIGGGENVEAAALAEILGAADSERTESFSILLKVSRLDK